MKNKSVPELIDQFERDILYDAHGLRIRVNRSAAGKELVRRGQSILAELADHLQKTDPDDKLGLRAAWGWLLIAIELKYELPNGPGMPNSLDSWIHWARAQAQ